MKATFARAAAVMGILVVASGALATTTSETISGNGAAASFATSSTNCIENFITVTAGTNVITPAGVEPVKAVLTIAQSDICLGQNLGTSSGVSTTVAFAGDLNSASLVGTITVFDENGVGRSVPVSLTWVGTGTTTHANTTTKFIAGNDITTIRTRDASRNATVTGSVDGFPVSPSPAMLFNDVRVTKTRTL